MGELMILNPEILKDIPRRRTVVLFSEGESPCPPLEGQSSSCVVEPEASLSALSTLSASAGLLLTRSPAAGILVPGCS